MPNNNENVSLSELANGAVPTAAPVGMPVKPKLDTSKAKDVSLSEVSIVTEPKPVEGTGNPMLDKAFEGLDDTINRIQDETNALYNKGQEERIQKSVDDADIDSVDSESTPSAVVVHKFDDEVSAEHLYNRRIKHLQLKKINLNQLSLKKLKQLNRLLKFQHL